MFVDHLLSSFCFYDNYEVVIASDNTSYLDSVHKKHCHRDNVIYAVCVLCRDHELAGFTEGVKIGLRQADEVG